MSLSHACPLTRVQHALLGAHVYRMLFGACNSMLGRIPVIRATTRPSPSWITRSAGSSTSSTASTSPATPPYSSVRKKISDLNFPNTRPQRSPGVVLPTHPHHPPGPALLAATICRSGWDLGRVRIVRPRGDGRIPRGLGVLPRVGAHRPGVGALDLGLVFMGPGLMTTTLSRMLVGLPRPTHAVPCSS